MSKKISKEFVKQTIRQLIRAKWRFPSILELSEALELSGAGVVSVLDALEKDQYVVKYDDWYRLATKEEMSNLLESNVADEIELVDQEEEEPEEETQQPIIMKRTTPIPRQPKKKVVPQDKKRQWSIIGLQISMLVIGLGAVILSIYYTTIWLIDFLPLMLAVLLSTIMVGFSVSAFETLIAFLSGKVKSGPVSKLIISSAFIVLWIIVTFFSITSTVAGQYNKHIDQVKKKIASSPTGYKLTAIREEKADCEIQLKDAREQLAMLSKIAGGMSDLSSRSSHGRVWNDTQWRMVKVNKTIAGLLDRIQKLRSQESELLNSSKESGIVLANNKGEMILDFYDWLARVLGLSKDQVQFWMSLFPAVFVDVIAPVSLAVALFLKRQEE